MIKNRKYNYTITWKSRSQKKQRENHHMMMLYFMLQNQLSKYGNIDNTRCEQFSQNRLVQFLEFHRQRGNKYCRINTFSEDGHIHSGWTVSSEKNFYIVTKVMGLIPLKEKHFKKGGKKQIWDIAQKKKGRM